MHELSIALSILDLVEEEAERHGGRVAAVHLRLGPLSGVVREALVVGLRPGPRGHARWREAELVVEEVAGRRLLPGLRRRAHAGRRSCELRCPDCGTPTPEVVRGRELEVVALEIES